VTKRLILFTLAMLMSAAVGVFANDNYKNGQDLTGPWKIQVTIPAGSSACPAGGGSCVYLVLATASSDGTVMQTAALPGVSTGHGVWKRTGLRQFTLKTTYFRLDLQGFPIGMAETVSVVEIKKNGLEASGTYSTQILDPAGLVIGGFQASVSATRIVP
jgi:hypothetical protein